MGFPLINIAAKVIKAAAGILGVDSIKDVVDSIENNKLTPEQRVAIETATQEHEKEMRSLDIEELKQVMSETSLMIQSDDKFVKRARPTGLYVAYACSIAMTVALISGTHVDATAILTLMAPLYGAQSLYIYKRTQEKMNGGSGD
jgi:hypothetical protein